MKTPTYILTITILAVLAFFGGQYAAKKPTAQKTSITPGASDVPQPPAVPAAPTSALQ